MPRVQMLVRRDGVLVTLLQHLTVAQPLDTSLGVAVVVAEQRSMTALGGIDLGTVGENLGDV